MSLREIRIRRGNALQIRVPVYDMVEAGGIETRVPREFPTGAVVSAAVRIGGVSIPATSVVIAADRLSIEVTFNRGLLPGGAGLIEIAVIESVSDAQSVACRIVVEPSAFDHEA